MNRLPAVWISKVRSLSDASFQSVLWGLEEEGIPFEIHEVGEGTSVELAKQAADGSPLAVGIGLGRRGGVVLHHHDLPAGMPLFDLSGEPPQATALRRLGMNAARLVKGQPLIMDRDESAAGEPEGCSRRPQGEMEILVELILEEILKHRAGDKR